MAKKKVSKAPGLSQKLGTGHGSPAKGLDLGSRLESAAKVPYKGYSSHNIRHGEMGLLSGTGGKKSLKVPNGG